MAARRIANESCAAIEYRLSQEGGDRLKDWGRRWREIRSKRNMGDRDAKKLAGKEFPPLKKSELPGAGAELLSAELWRNKPKASQRVVVTWVAQNIFVDARAEDSPSPEAWALLKDARDPEFRQKTFWSQMYRPVLSQGEVLDKWEDDGRVLDTIEARLRTLRGIAMGDVSPGPVEVLDTAPGESKQAAALRQPGPEEDQEEW